MDYFEERWWVTVSCGLLVLMASLVVWGTSRPRGFPPGPRGVPFLGSVFSMTASPEEVFSRWSRQYGDVFGFKAGQRWIVVINHEEAIREAVIKHGIEFAGRPDFFSFEVFTYGFKDIILSSYSETWKLHRKLANAALRQFATGKRLECLLHGAFSKLELFLEDCDVDEPVDPKLAITLLLYNIMSTMCFGKNYDLVDEKLVAWKESIEKLNEEFGLGVAADFFRWAAWFPTAGVKMVHRMKHEFHQFVWDELENHKKSFDPDKVGDFFDLLLLTRKEANDEMSSDSEKLSDTHLVMTVSNMFAAGISTTTETLYWAFALMAEHPHIQTKVRAEIDTVIGRGRFPVIDDRGSMPFTEATLYEVMRYSTILPNSLPHATTADVLYRGFRIPKGTLVMLNIHSMHYDPNSWDSPDTFRPEHFLDEDGEVRQHPPGFLPFGAGRRSCLGEAVAKADLFLIFTWFLQNYSFSKVEGSGTEDGSLLRVIANTAMGRHLRNYKLCIRRRTPQKSDQDD